MPRPPALSPITRGALATAPSKAQRRILAGTAVTLLASAVLTARGGDADRGRAPAAGDFAATRDAGRGQTVRWGMFGGDDRVNAYVDDTVAPAARSSASRSSGCPSEARDLQAFLSAADGIRTHDLLHGKQIGRNGEGQRYPCKPAGLPGSPARERVRHHAEFTRIAAGSGSQLAVVPPAVAPLVRVRCWLARSVVEACAWRRARGTLGVDARMRRPTDHVPGRVPRADRGTLSNGRSPREE
jgi:hypothetical protein